jgi:hypothetical protein
VKTTNGFESDLDRIEQFCRRTNSIDGYDRLLASIKTIVIPNVRRFPSMGRAVLAIKPDSVEALVKRESILENLRDEGTFREYLLDDHLLLYAHVADVVYLVSIRHMKQLSVDFEHLWLGGP